MERNKKATILAFVVVFVVPLILFAYWFKRPRPLVEVLPIHGGYYLEESIDTLGNVFFDTIQHTIPNFQLISHMGDTVDQTIMQRKIVIAGFFFTGCSDACTDVSASLSYLQDVYSNQDSLIFLYHTIDPSRDSVSVLYDFAVKHNVNNARWLLLTGQDSVLNDLASIGYLLAEQKDDIYEFNYSYHDELHEAEGLLHGQPGQFINCEKLVLIDKDRQIRGYYDGTSAEDIERLRLDTKRLFLTSDFPHTRLNKTNRP